MLNSLINEPSLRQSARLSSKMLIVVLEHKLIDVDLADASRYAPLGNFVCETIGAVEDYSHSACSLFVDGF